MQFQATHTNKITLHCIKYACSKAKAFCLDPEIPQPFPHVHQDLNHGLLPLYNLVNKETCDS